MECELPTLDHFTGQEDVTARLKVALEASWADHTPLPHMLVTGPPGCGKTTLARIVARELQVELHERIGQVLDNMGTVNGLLMAAQPRSIIFIDEAHELPRHCQTLLYRAMEHQMIFVQTTNTYETLKMKVNAFSVMLGTTDAYSLLAPLRDRCPLQLQFSYYATEALTRILLQRAAMMKCPMETEVAASIAHLSRGTPRIAVRLLESCLRVARSQGAERITRDHFKTMVVLEQLDSVGLNRDEQRYLRYLADRPGEQVRVGTLESALGIHCRTLMHVIEPFLLRLSFIERAPGGRLITEAGLEHVSRSSSDDPILL